MSILCHHSCTLFFRFGWALMECCLQVSLNISGAMVTVSGRQSTLSKHSTTAQNDDDDDDDNTFWNLLQKFAPFGILTLASFWYNLETVKLLKNLWKFYLLLMIRRFVPNCIHWISTKIILKWLLKEYMTRNIVLFCEINWRK